VGKRIIERRVWQSYREVRELGQRGQDGDEIERLVLSRWKALDVDDIYVNGNISRLFGDWV
jgi:hypothetical protein